MIYHALNEAYQAVLARGRYPSAFLFIECPPDQVDVNVHPAKKEVRFRHPAAVREAVIAAVQKALALQAPEAERQTLVRKFDPPNLAPRAPKQREFPYPPPAVPPGPIPTATPPANAIEPPVQNAEKSPWKSCRVLGQVGGIYGVLETEDGLVLMEPQAAHERVLFEKIMRDLTTGKPARQGLLAPEAIALMPADADALRRHLSILDEMGFGISDFGHDTFILDALPVYLQNGSPTLLLSGIAHALEKSGTATRATREALRETVAQAVCRTSIQANTSLSTAAIEQLVADLAKTEMPYTSPQGVPTLIFTSFTELHRKFRR